MIAFLLPGVVALAIFKVAMISGYTWTHLVLMIGDAGLLALPILALYQNRKRSQKEFNLEHSKPAAQVWKEWLEKQQE
ncbi:MAG: hypothetical protein ACRECH_07265 [Nitrososphaerales archaeon]